MKCFLFIISPKIDPKEAKDKIEEEKKKIDPHLLCIVS